MFLDEATNSLDANNERFIMEKLNKIFKDKTVLIIAHRLSTVKNADKRRGGHEHRLDRSGLVAGVFRREVVELAL